MRETLAQAVWRKRLDQAAAQAGHALAHTFQLVQPEALQFVVAEYLRHHRRAMGGRRRPQVTGDGGQLAADVDEFLGVAGADDQGPGALAIQAEVLRAGTGDQQLRQLGGEQTHGPGVLLQPVAKALIGEVDQRQQFAYLDHFQYALEVARCQVEPGGVVATGMQQHHVALGQVGEGGDHGLHVEAVVGADVRIVADPEPGFGEQGFMDRPGRIAQPDAASGQAVTDEITRQAQRTGTAGRLRGAGAPLGEQWRVRTEDQLAQDRAVRRVAVATDIGLGLLEVDQAVPGQLHRAGNRRPALGVPVHACNTVQARRVGVQPIGFHQAEDGVARHAGGLGKVAHLRPSALAASTSVRAAMMKSLRCRPRISWLHQVTVTLPHSVSRAGWWPTSSAMAPTALVKARAWRKFLNRYTRSSSIWSPRTSMFQSGISRISSASSSSDTFGASARQASHWAWARLMGVSWVF